MLDFCTMHQLTVDGTLFEHKDIHKTTWRSPSGLTVTQIDHMYISTRWSHSLLMRGADINTTHYLVRGYLSNKLKCPQKRNKDVKRPALNHLHNKSRSKEYSDKIAERFSENAKISSLEDKWIKLRDTINEVSFGVLGEKDRRKKRRSYLRGN